MKKIIFLVIVVGLALLPVVGNKYVQTHIKEKVANLESFGLGVKEHSVDSTYLSSKEHYEFLLKDADKFLEYLSQYSDKQIPRYVDAALEGVLVGMDVEYSNIPFMKAVAIDIYPLALSPKMQESIKKDDLDFYTYLEKFLESKGILYHINYNIMSKDFDGFIKDVAEKYTLKDGTELALELKKANYSGNGDIIAPQELSSSIDSVDLQIKSPEAKLSFELKDLSSSYSFNSQSTYVSGGKINSLLISVDGTNDNLYLNAQELQVNISSNDQGKKAELNAKASMQALAFKSKQLNFQAKDLAYDIAASKLDKDLLEKLRVMVAQANTKPSLELSNKITEVSVALFSKGMNLKIVQWYVRDITLNQTQKLGGFDVKMDLDVKEDADLAKKIQISPMLVAQNINMTLNVEISKIIYANLTANQPMTGAIQQYIKEDGDKLIFDIVFKDGALTLNGKPLQ
jgi:hypothetical protein